jgi:glyoxylase-like metal-dependent hydrolase (beta-lactamase superfamily II)
MEVTGAAQRRAWYDGTMPPVERVTDGVWSIPVPVPDNPVRYTLCYVLLGAQACVVVDPGWDDDNTWTALTAGLARAGVRVEDIAGILVTHVHPDHHGLSGRLAAASGAWIAMHPEEREMLVIRVSDQRQEVDRAWLAAQGVPAETIAEIVTDIRQLAKFAAMARPTVELADDDLVPLPGRRIRALATPGHTPGHLCLYDEDEKLLFTGDHVLPRITPNVGLQPFAARPPLGRYLNSLERIRPFAAAEVLPAHEWRFRGLDSRLDELADHHAERSAEVLGVVAEDGPLSVWAITERLTWSRGWAHVRGFQRRAALAETRAHVLYLAESGRVRVSEDEHGVGMVSS